MLINYGCEEYVADKYIYSTSLASYGISSKKDRTPMMKEVSMLILPSTYRYTLWVA